MADRGSPFTRDPAPGSRSAVARFLSANMLCAVIGFLQTVVVVRICGPTHIGVSGVLIAVTHLLINLVDIRVGDLSASLLSRIPQDPNVTFSEDRPATIRAIIRNGFILQLGLIFIIYALAGPLTALYAFWNSEYATTTFGLLWVAPLVGIAGYVNGFLVGIHRLLLSRRVIISAQLAGAVLNALFTVFAVILSPDASGIIWGSILGAVSQAIISGCVVEYAYTHSLTGIWARSHWWSAFAYGWEHRSFLWASNLYGYARSLHRGVDVLIVSLFCSPAVTGLYKFARGTTDNLSIFVDALNKHFYPELLQLSRKATSDVEALREHRRFARNFVQYGLLIGGLVIAAEIVLLEPLVALVFGAPMAAATPALIVFTCSYVLLGGVNLWLWPWVVAQSRMADYAAGAFIGALCCQYAIPLMVVVLYGPYAIEQLSDRSAALLFAVAHVLVYPLHFGWVLRSYFAPKRNLTHAATQQSSSIAVSHNSSATPLGRLFFVAFELDLDSQVLRWQHELVRALAAKSERVCVLTDRRGRTDLPANVSVITVPLLFQKLPFRWLGAKFLVNLRLLPVFIRGIDLAFYHMNFSWLNRLAPLHVIRPVPTLMWYAHGSVTRALRVAHVLCDRVITSSPDGFRVPSDKLSIIGQGVDAGVYQLSTAPMVERNRVLSVGRLSASKNVRRIIDSFAELKRITGDPSLVLTIVGEEPSGERTGYRESLEQYAASIGLKDSVKLTGKLSPGEIAARYTDACLHINLSDTGSMDKTVLEALAAGCPVITSNPAYHRMLSGIEGAVVLTTDPTQIAQQMRSIIGQFRLGALHSEALRQFVIEGKHDFESYCGRIIEELIRLRDHRSTADASKL